MMEFTETNITSNKLELLISTLKTRNMKSVIPSM